jgi:hypothetical protein
MTVNAIAACFEIGFTFHVFVCKDYGNSLKYERLCHKSSRFETVTSEI